MRLRKIKNAYNKLLENELSVFDKDTKNRWQHLFSNTNPIHLEIGCGKGKFIIEMAQKFPGVNFIAVEKYDSVLLRVSEKLIENPLSNVRMFLLDAFEIENYFGLEIDRLYLNFSDPWPKKKHSKRRLTSPNFLDKYKKIVKNDIIFKTDNIELFNYSVESFVDSGLEVLEKTNDLHSLNVDNVMTEFEEKFSKEGYKINRLIGRIKHEK